MKVTPAHEDDYEKPKATAERKIAAIYARVSTEDQTVSQQVAPLKRMCEENNWEYEVFSEKVSGGANAHRTQLDTMMQRIRGKHFNIVMVTKLDRLGRSLKHLITLIEEFNNKDVKFICLSPNVDTTTTQGRFFIQIMGAVAELEREMISERTREKLRYLKAQGVKLGRPKGSPDKKPRRKSGYYLYWDEKNKKNRRY